MKKLALVIGVTAAFGINSAQADQVILDDLIVDGSICVGQDCVNGESFGFDTIRLKENNLRIRFEDTSTTSSFPSRDWQITVNDSVNGGLNKFSIEDIDAGSTPFTVEGGAPSHSLYVDDGGRLGLGTSTPVVQMHSKDGNTPTLRLEQDGSSGFTPQVWDVAGNEAGFFVRDATNGSTLPFRIRPGAPNESLDIQADGTVNMGGNAYVAGNAGIAGDVGIGTNSPGSQLHLNESASGTAVKLIMENSGSATSWEFVHRAHVDDAFAINTPSIDGAEFILSTNGNLKITGALTTAGSTCGGGCDTVFHSTYELESIEEHAKQMWKNSYLPAVGQTVEGAPFNVSQKTQRMLNELEKAHIFIEQLNARVKSKDAEISMLRMQQQEFADRLARIEGSVERK